MAAFDREVLVCYDIASSKTRSQLADFLKDLGLQALQESVFWGRLRPAEERAVEREFPKRLDPATDRALMLPVDLGSGERIAAFGYAEGAFLAPPRSRVL